MTDKHLILVVDDDPDFRDSLRIILEGNGYRVLVAANGREALAFLRTTRPSLIILDVMMSTDTEGFDLAFELKNQAQYEDLPIILLTSFLEKVRMDGPDDYQHILGEQWPAQWLFEKPVDQKRLLAKIQGILQ